MTVVLRESHCVRCGKFCREDEVRPGGCVRCVPRTLVQMTLALYGQLLAQEAPNA